jgi:hypothetical protein
MTRVFELARLKDCRVILSGDTGQHASVTRGDALRILEQYSGYRFEELTTIRRQKPAAFREIVELGAVTEALTDDGQLYQRAADAYLASTKQGKSVLLVSPTWSEIEAVTDKVREALKADGVISQQDEPVMVFDSLSWTEAQKKNASQFEPGQRLRFVRKTKKFERGETAEVVAVTENGLRVRRPDGLEVDFIPSGAAASFDVGEARELKVAAGDWLLLQANHGKEFINGERVQVREIQNGRIALADDRVLPGTFNTFTHGYAVTSHSSQSKTVDDVLLVASSKSFAAVNREQFYVSISRGRERVHVFTDDADLLARRVTDSHERKAAVELQALRDDLAKLGFVRREQLKEKTPSPVAEDFRMVAMRQHRPMRQTRATRFTRLAPVQRIAQVVEELRRWFAERLGVEVLADGHHEAVAEKTQQTEPVKQAEKIAPAVKETPGQKLRRDLERIRREQQQQRRSGGIHM